MKKLFTILFLVCTFAGFSQVDSATVVRIIDARVGPIDSTVHHTLQTVGTASDYADTLDHPGDVVTYQLFITSYNPATHDVGSAEKVIVIRNVGGIYSLIRDFNAMSYSVTSVAKPAITLVQMNGVYLVRVKGISGHTIKWSCSKNIFSDTPIQSVSIPGSATRIAAPAQEIVTPLSVNIFPNPSNGYFTVVTKSGSEEKINIKLFSSTGIGYGEIVTVPANWSTIMGKNLFPGVYIIEVTQGSQKVVTEVVKM